MRTRIISAFPGTGKSYYHKKNPDTTLDSDSSKFGWFYYDNGEKVRNGNFPQNYIGHIRQNIGKYEFIFVSSHKEVRDALLDNCLFFYLVYPDTVEGTKQKYLKRFKDRGSPESFIKRLDKNWYDWIFECEKVKTGCCNCHMEMGSNHTLEEVIRRIVVFNE